MKSIEEKSRLLQDFYDTCNIRLNVIWHNLPDKSIIHTSLDEASQKFIESAPVEVISVRAKSFKWIVTTACYLIKDELRKQNREKEIIEYYDDFSFNALDISDKDETEKKIDWRISFDEICCLLPTRQADIFRMERDGFTNFEIAERLEISTTTVKNEKRKYKEYIRKYVPPPKLIFSEA